MVTHNLIHSISSRFVMIDGFFEKLDDHIRVSEDARVLIKCLPVLIPESPSRAAVHRTGTVWQESYRHWLIVSSGTAIDLPFV